MSSSGVGPHSAGYRPLRLLIVHPGVLSEVVQALPVIADIRTVLPDAVVDWVVEPALAPLVRRVEQVGEVIEGALRRWRERWWTSATRAEWRAFKQRLRRDAYDAAIDLQGQTGSAFVARLARGRSYGIANRTEGSRHQAPARWLVDLAITLPVRIHTIDRSRQLVARVLAQPVQGPPRFGLHGRARKLEQPTVVFVHGSSREDKQWPETRWIALGRHFVETGWHVALPHGDEFELVRAEQLAAAIDSQATAFLDTKLGAGAAVQVWPRLKLEALLDRLGAVHGVIGVDSGLSHLAVALGLPHVQIYLQPTAWRTGPQPAHGQRHQRSVGGETSPSVDEVWAAWQRVDLRARSGAE